MLDFYLKNQILIFIIISVFILYSVRFANSPQLLNAILIITLIYYIFFSDTINLKNIKSNTNPDRFLHKYPEIYDIKTKLKVINSFDVGAYNDLVAQIDSFILLYEKINNNIYNYKYNYDIIYQVYKNIINIPESIILSIPTYTFYKLENIENYIHKYNNQLKLILYNYLENLNDKNIAYLQKSGYTKDDIVSDPLIGFDNTFKKDNHYQLH
jgi:hypothetical protein